MTFGGSAAARVRIVVWCRSHQHQAEPDPAELAAQHGAETPVLNWHERLICSNAAAARLTWWCAGRSGATSPDAGKMMLAARLPGIPAPLQPAEASGIRLQSQKSDRKGGSRA
jgi:hypothetical protein